MLNRKEWLSRTLAVLIIAVFSSQNSSADQIDELLRDLAPRIRETLEDRGVKSVGVLPFRVWKDKGPYLFVDQQLSTNVAERLRNALITSVDPEDPEFVILRDPDISALNVPASNTSVSAASSILMANYRKADDRRELFSMKYPPAVGVEQQSAEVFLCGRIVLSPDKRITSVDIECFSAGDVSRVERFIKTQVPTDRSILADAGYGFAARTKLVNGLRRGPDNEDIIDGVYDSILLTEPAVKVDSPNNTDPADPSAPNAERAPFFDSGTASEAAAEPVIPYPTPVIPAPRIESVDPPAEDRKPIEFPVELTVSYDDEPQPLQPEPGEGAYSFTMPDPKHGQRMTFTLRNKTNAKIGVVLSINGTSTLYGQTAQAELQQKWLLDAGKTYQIKGIHRDREFAEIRGLSEEESLKRYEDLGGAQMAGLIHLYVFESVDSNAAASDSVTSLRRLPDGLGPITSIADMQQKIHQNGINVEGARGLADISDTKGVETLNQSELGPTELTATMVVRYYAKPRSYSYE